MPSGWFSDRVGRVDLAGDVHRLVAAFLCFLIGGVGPIVAGQMLLAVGYASLSGTDVTFLFETLDAAGLAHRFEAEEVRAREGSLYLTAITALAGGGLGMLDLRLPFLAALTVAVGQLAITWKMDEPPRDPGHVSSGWRHDVAAVVTHLRTRTLAWITLYVVAEVVLIHLASEFASPYAATVLDRPVDNPAGAAIVAGVVVAASALVGALVVRFFVPMQQRIGTLGVLVGVGFVSASIVGLMATEIALWVLPFLALRGAQASVTAVAVPAAVGRRVEVVRRATTLSAMSLMGRGTYALVLVTFSMVSADTLTGVLDTAAVTVFVVAAGVTAAAALMRPELDSPTVADR